MSFLGLLGLLFIGLRLSNVITWSWALVLLPLYGGVAFLLITFLLVFIAAVIKG